VLNLPVKNQNQLFNAIPTDEWERLLPHIEKIHLPLGKVICEPDMRLAYAYFPITAIISLLHELENGTSAEVAVVGNEGLIGVSIFMGGGTTSSTAVVNTAGIAYRVPSAILLNEFNQCAPLMHLLLRFTQALITQMTQTAVCNRHHRLEQQLCRFLLENSDRLSCNEMTMTQELISKLLGVRREGITEMALRIQKAGLIKYARGHITILDRAGLEHRSCECYQVVKTECNRLLPEKIAV
jgi:CRP-like cAMP-binding protein